MTMPDMIWAEPEKLGKRQFYGAGDWWADPSVTPGLTSYVRAAPETLAAHPVVKELLAKEWERCAEFLDAMSDAMKTQAKLADVAGHDTDADFCRESAKVCRVAASAIRGLK